MKLDLILCHVYLQPNFAIDSIEKVNNYEGSVWSQPPRINLNSAYFVLKAMLILNEIYLSHKTTGNGYKEKPAKNTHTKVDT